MVLSKTNYVFCFTGLSAALQYGRNPRSCMPTPVSFHQLGIFLRESKLLVVPRWKLSKLTWIWWDILHPQPLPFWFSCCSRQIVPKSHWNSFCHDNDSWLLFFWHQRKKWNWNKKMVLLLKLPSISFTTNLLCRQFTRSISTATHWKELQAECQSCSNAPSEIPTELYPSSVIYTSFIVHRLRLSCHTDSAQPQYPICISQDSTHTKWKLYTAAETLGKVLIPFSLPCSNSSWLQQWWGGELHDRLSGTIPTDMFPSGLTLERPRSIVMAIPLLVTWGNNNNGRREGQDFWNDHSTMGQRITLHDVYTHSVSIFSNRFFSKFIMDFDSNQSHAQKSAGSW